VKRNNTWWRIWPRALRCPRGRRRRRSGGWRARWSSRGWRHWSELVTVRGGEEARETQTPSSPSSSRNTNMQQ